MSISLLKGIDKRSKAGDWHTLAEHELQYQYEIAGTVGTLPAETQVTLSFDVIFLTDPGNQRDSTLDRPQFRPGFEFDYTATGMIPYAYVAEWVMDSDFNIVGAKVVIGVHSPAAQFQGLTVAQAQYKGAVHLSFQGWCLPTDPDGPYDSGGAIDLAGAN